MMHLAISAFRGYYSHMTNAPGTAARLPRPHLPRGRAARVAMVVAAGTGLILGGRVAWEKYQTWGTPTCSWPLQVRGPASPAQIGLVGCYLQALSGRDTAGLLGVADYDPPVRITSADLTYSRDARAGMATATFAPSLVSVSFAPVIITYADGVRDNLSMQNMAAMGDSSGWRMCIGTVINPSGPPPATASPSS